MIRILAIATATVVLAGGAAFYLLGGSQDADRYAQCRASNVAGGVAQIGGPFELVDETGATVTDREVLDEPALIYFGYTFCPDVCPMDVARNALAVDVLEERGQSVRPVMISIDPARDTPEVMAEFTNYMHPRMLGLTGSAEQVRAAAKAYRVYVQAQAPEPGAEDAYLVDHSTMSYLTLPGHGFVEFFRRDESPERIADRVGCFLDATG